MDVWTEGKNSPEQLIEYILGLNFKLSGNLLVCFDYFDTLITRKVDPEYTKVIACSLLSQALHLPPANGEELYSIRQRVELEMTNANAELNGELEFRLDDFAHIFRDNLLERFKPQVEAFEQEEFTTLLIEIEVAVEKNVQQLCPSMLEVLTALEHVGIDTVLVSDFYLPQPYFGKMVQHQGLDRYFPNIYVSSDLGISKGSGKLYGEVCRRHTRLPSEVLMIGDNPHADIDMARKNGLHSLLMNRPAQLMRYQEYRKQKEVVALEGAEKLYSEVMSPNVPFKEMGSSLWLFIHKLFSELTDHKIKDIFFLSKEGEFLKKLFDVYQELLFGRNLIRSHYLVASRKATFIASLRPLPEEDFSRLLDHYRDLSIREFLRSLNFTEQDVSTVVQRLGIDCDCRLPGLASQQDFNRLINLEVFGQLYEKYRTEQCRNFKAYLQSYGVDLERHGLPLVDVGWKGSIQDNIFHILKEEILVRGFYIGSFNATGICDKNLKRGLLFDNSRTISKHFDVYNNNRSLFEMLLGATHGSAERYVVDSNRNDMTTNLSEAQVYSQIVIDGGRVQVVVLDHPEERKLFHTRIKPLQDGFFDYFKQLTLKYLDTGCRFPSETWFARCHGRMVYLPTRDEIEFFESLYHLENFGVFEFTDFKPDHQFSIYERVIHLKNIILDPPVLEVGIWPPLLLRRFGIGFWQKVDGRKRYFREFGMFG